MKTALLVIDVQKIYTDPESEMYCGDAKATVTRINRIIEKFEKSESPIILIRHIHKSDGSDLGRIFDFEGEAPEDFNFKEKSEEVDYDEKLTKPKTAKEIVKTRYSAFEGTNLLKMLREMKVEKIVICGFMTNFCCETTARDGHGKDFFVDFITDATGTPGTDKFDEKSIRNFVADIMENGFACVYNTEDYLDQ